MTNRPTILSDPSGHRACGEGENSNCDGSFKYNGERAAKWALKNWNNDKVTTCQNPCTEFVSTALHQGGLPIDPEKWYPPDACSISCSWNFTDDLHHYLTEDLGFEQVELPKGTDLQEWFKNNELPAGAVVFYDNGFIGKGFTFDHAAITTGQTETYQGITGSEVVDQNNAHVVGPHFIGDTSIDYRFVIAFLP